MLIFNTTFHVDDEVHDAYLCFMRDEYISTSTESGFLFDPRFARIYAQHEQSGVSYSLQFKVKNTDALDYWLSNGGGILNKKMLNKFGTKVNGFITLMEEVNIDR